MTVPYEGPPVVDSPDYSGYAELETNRQIREQMRPDEYRLCMDWYNAALPGSSGTVGVWVATGVVVRRWHIVGSITVAPENEHWRGAGPRADTVSLRTGTRIRATFRG